MKTLLEFCDKYRISHAKAKRMQKDGFLLVDTASNPAAAAIREVMMQRNPLGVVELCLLLETPSLILELGRYADKASEVLETIGDALTSQAPHPVALSILDAASGDAEAIAALVDWIKSALPVDGSPVGYHWLAVRLMLPLPENIRKFENERIRRALARARKDPAFAGWWTYRGRYNRKETIYARPENSLASLDL